MTCNHDGRRTLLRFLARGAAAAAGAWIALVPSGSPAQPQDGSLGAADVVRLAAASPSVAAARADIRAARGRLAAAYAPSLENPTLEAMGTVDDPDGRPRWEVSVPFGLGPAWITRVRRERRIVEREEATAAEARRSAVGDALRAYYRAHHADRRREIAGRRLDMAERWFAAAGERERA
jgi:outer membrane protein TolC